MLGHNVLPPSPLPPQFFIEREGGGSGLSAEIVHDGVRKTAIFERQNNLKGKSKSEYWTTAEVLYNMRSVVGYWAIHSFRIAGRKIPISETEQHPNRDRILAKSDLGQNKWSLNLIMGSERNCYFCLSRYSKCIARTWRCILVKTNIATVESECSIEEGLI